MEQNIDVNRGDIIWLKKEMPYYEIGGSVQTIDRPYIVISNNKNNDKAPTVNLACISKQVTKVNYPMHVFLDKNKYKLKHNSIVLAEQVMTVPKSYIAEKVSSLDNQDMKKLNKAIFIQMIDEECNVSVV